MVEFHGGASGQGVTLALLRLRLRQYVIMILRSLRIARVIDLTKVWGCGGWGVRWARPKQAWNPERVLRGAANPDVSLDGFRFIEARRYLVCRSNIVSC